MERRTIRRCGLAVAFLLFLASTATTPFWRAASAALSPRLPPYPQLRSASAFGGLVVDRIAERLDVLLPAGTPVALGERLAPDEFYSQRFAEALYPRILDPRSSHTIEVSESPPPGDFAERVLGQVRLPEGPRLLVLAGSLDSRPATPPPARPLDFSWIELGGCLLSTLGIGLAIGLVLPKSVRPRPEIAPFAAVLSCALLFALLASAATVAQVGLPWTAVALSGPLALAGAILFDRSRGRILAESLTGLRNALPLPENWALGTILLLFSVRLARFPIIGWDGRSIWFFRAKQLFEHGMFTREDLLRPSYHFTHPDYPPFYPAWVSFFSRLSAGYNERLAAMAIPVVVASLTAILWALSRRQLGRWRGAAFTLIAFFATAELSAAGLVDGIVALLLLIGFFSFADPRSQGLAWIATAAASLSKQEGFALGALSVLICTAALPGLRRAIVKARGAPLASFLPAAGYLFWTRSLGIRGDFDGIPWGLVFRDLSGRLRGIAQGAFAVLSNDSSKAVTVGWIVLEGAVGLSAGLFLLWRGAKGDSALPRLCMALGLAFGAFACGVFLLTPLDLRWHVGTAIGRLLLHPALFFVLVPFLISRTGEPPDPEGIESANLASFVKIGRSARSSAG